MGVNDWFRRTTWSKADEAEFFSRLARSRTRYNKAQYLRIQASHLADTAVERNLRSAIDLLNIVLAEYEDQRHEKAVSLALRAGCRAGLGEYEAAITDYRGALAAQHAYPQTLTPAHAAFAELVVTLERRDLYSEVLTALAEFGHIDVFPKDIYRSQEARAFIAAESGDKAKAREHAERALVAAAATDSGFRFHKKLGLVGSVSPERLERLRVLTVA